MFKKMKQLFCRHDWCIEEHHGLIPLNRPEYMTYVFCSKCGLKGDYNSLSRLIYHRDGNNVIERFKERS